MATSVIAIGLIAAVFWGSSPVCSKLGLTHGGRPILVATVVVLTGNVIFWGALVATGGPLLEGLGTVAVVIFLIGGLIGTSIGRITHYTGIQKIGASPTSAAIATTPLFAAIIAALTLGELISVREVLGIVVVVFGLLSLAVSKGGDVSGWRTAALAFPLTAALAYGSGSVIRRYGLLVTTATPLQGVAINEAAALVGLLAYLFTHDPRSVFRTPARSYAYFLVTGVLSSIGLLLFFEGLARGRVAIIATLIATQTIFATGLSYLLLGDVERITRGIVAGAILVAGGVALLST